MFNNLSDKLDKALQVLKGHGRITEINVAETLKEVRRALLDADVNFKIAKDFTKKVKEKAIGQNVLTDLKPGQLMVKIVKDELSKLMGGDASEIDVSKNPSIILMSGLQGSGKTTFSGKLANFGIFFNVNFSSFIRDLFLVTVNPFTVVSKEVEKRSAGKCFSSSKPLIVNSSKLSSLLMPDGKSGTTKLLPYFLIW